MPLIHRLKRHFVQRKLGSLVMILVAAFIILPFDAFSAPDALSRSIDVSRENNSQEAGVQQQINDIDDATREMLDEYLRLSRELEALQPYNEQLERMVGSQVAEQQSLEHQMAALEETQRDVVPLMLKMVAWLQTLQQHDLPFLPQERTLRITPLQCLMDRADITLGEKYRRVLEAYQIELDYSRTIEAYRDELKIGDESRTVDFLRMGRVGLYYLTLDRNESGYWNHLGGFWVTLPSDANLEVRKGLRIARQQAAPDLLRLPVAAPQEVQP